MKSIISKEQLKNLYIIQNLSRDMICEKLNISHGRFNRLIEKFNIPKKDQKTINESIKITWENNWGTNKIQGLSEIRNKFKQTCIKKFGTDHPLKSKEIRDKIEKTNLQKYGVKSVVYLDSVKEKIGKANKITASSPEVQRKVKQTNIERFGVDSYSKTKAFKNLMHDKAKEILAKKKKTCIKHYGVDSYSKTSEYKEKYIQTSFKKYGVPYYTQTQEYLDRQYRTKKKNRSFSQSKTEDETYSLLLTKFNKKDIERQYRSKLYPFHCDFYIKSLDLYIECQYGWTHGKDHKPYDPLNSRHLEIVNIWEKKSKSKKFYKRAIETWTIRDPLKREIAKNNKLNYKEFFTIEDFKDWLENIC